MAEVADDRIICEIDGALTHSIQNYIKKNHPDWTIEKYQAAYPKAPLLSPKMMEAIREKRAKEAAAAAPVGDGFLRPMAEIFGLPAEAGKTKKGKVIMCQTIDPATVDEEDKIFIPDIDPNYVFNVELTKSALMVYQLNKPGYFWGLHGTGKTTLWEQAAARTGRPFLRLQHTISTEESHILGQWTVKNGETVFVLGPLPMAMLRGYVYCADEYDIALPAVTAVYQPVLEGKALLIKEAPPELRVIRPHKNFRFVATGNTNGCGDHTGLYQGTTVQNAAQYSRFGITEEVDYPEEKVETAIISKQSQIRMDEAGKLVKFATEVRKSFRAGSLSATISPRELINAGILGLVRGGDWSGGLRQAFMNRLSPTDKETCVQLAQRFFGS